LDLLKDFNPEIQGVLLNFAKTSGLQNVSTPELEADLKKLVPEDAKEAIGHGLRAKRSKSGAVSFDVMDVEAADASLQ